MQNDRNGIIEAWLAKGRYYFYQKNTEKTFIYTDLVKYYGKELKKLEEMFIAELQPFAERGYHTAKA